MVFGREVDDPARLSEDTLIVNEHRANADFTTFTSAGVSSEILWKSVFELQRNSFAHDANGVDCVDDGICGCEHQITAYELEHRIRV